MGRVGRLHGHPLASSGAKNSYLVSADGWCCQWERSGQGEWVSEGREVGNNAVVAESLRDYWACNGEWGVGDSKWSWCGQDWGWQRGWCSQDWRWERSWCSQHWGCERSWSGNGNWSWGCNCDWGSYVYELSLISFCVTMNKY